ncbi:fibrous sheath-interacting protein 2-like [Aplochiton taeniatus]
MDNENDGSLSTTHLLDLTVRGKIPVLPGVSQVYHTTRLCEKLVQPKSGFDLTDPNGHLLCSEYSILNDPNLKGYLQRKDIRQRLIDGGLITKDDKVICSLKHLNRYRDHLTDVELDWSRRFRTEQKELLRRFLTLQRIGKVPETVTLSDVTEWILGRAKNSFGLRQQMSKQRMCNSSGEQGGSSLLRLPNIALTNSMVKLNCCPGATCRSESMWNAKGRQILMEVTKEVKREMRLERRFEIDKVEKRRQVLTNPVYFI